MSGVLPSVVVDPDVGRETGPALHVLDVRAPCVPGGDAVRLPDLTLFAGRSCTLAGADGAVRRATLDVLGLTDPPGRAKRLLLASAADGTRRVVDVAAAWRSSNRARPCRLRARWIGRTGSADTLFSFLSVGANIELPRRLAGQGVRREETERRMCRAGLQRSPDAPVTELTAAERRRVSVLQAFAHRPALVLAEEPVVGLSHDQASDVVRTLRDEIADTGAALIVAARDRTPFDDLSVLTVTLGSG